LKTIGGFLGLEPTLPAERGDYHSGVALSNARSCFALMLDQLEPRRLCFPYYICGSMASIAKDCGVALTYYSIDNQFEIQDLPVEPGPREFLLYVNYFGLKDSYVNGLSSRFGDRLIIDDTQAFFRHGSPEELRFNSARKFFGVADGAYCGLGSRISLPPLEVAKLDHQHLIHRVNGLEELAYQQFRAFEAGILPTACRISDFSLDLLKRIDYEAVSRRRRSNFAFLQRSLERYNELGLSLEAGSVPLYFPFLSRMAGLREKLIERRIFVPTLWRSVLESQSLEGSWEGRFARQLCALPIDQRYTCESMDIIRNTIEGLLSHE